jgi:hypothetical protein
MNKFLSITIRLAERWEGGWRSSVAGKFVSDLSCCRCSGYSVCVGLCRKIFGQKNNPAPEGARLFSLAYALIILPSNTALISLIWSC